MWTPGTTLTAQRTVDPYRSLYYAAASGDFNPLHIDPAFGAALGYGGTILHGLCTLSWMVETVVAQLSSPLPIAGARARFSRPVRAGDSLRFTGTAGAVVDRAQTIDFDVRTADDTVVLKEAQVVVADQPSPWEESPTTLHETAWLETAVEASAVRSFARAIGGGIPSDLLPGDPSAFGCRAYHEEGWHPSGVVAPPTFCATFALRPVVACLLDASLGLDLGAVVHAAQEWRFVSPVRPGDRIRSRARLVAREERGGRSWLTIETRSTRPNGAPVVQGRFTGVVS